MKAKIEGVEVEGTPDEIRLLIRAMQVDSKVGIPDTKGGAGKQFVEEELAFRVLKRRPLSREQIAILTLLRANQPNWTTAKELQKAANYNPSQLAGLLGAFGKRLASTEGYRAGTWFFDQEWDYDHDCNRYRLPAGALAAVRRAGL